MPPALAPPSDSTGLPRLFLMRFLLSRARPRLRYVKAMRYALGLPERGEGQAVGMMGWRCGLRSAAIEGFLVIRMPGEVAPVAVVMAAPAKWACRSIGGRDAGLQRL